MPTVETAAVIDPPLKADPPPAAASGAPRFVRAVRQAPFTVALLSALWVLGAWTHSLSDGPPRGWPVGVGLDALAHGRWWTVGSSLLWCPNLPTYLVVSLGLIGLLGPAEARLGTRRTVVLAVIIQLGALVLGLGMIALGVALGRTWWP